jgi:hypothetical protein
MKKRLLILTLGLLFAGAAQAQIFIEEGDAPTRATTTEVPAWVDNPEHGESVDHYLPLGDGLLALSALGGLYLLRKKKNKNK